jgi:hypothetical protein
MVWPKVVHRGQSSSMGDFVPQELWDHVPYPWAESASEEAKAYGMLLRMQSEMVDAMREEGACLAREKIARAVRREIVTMTYAADAGHLELDVHVRVCWVPKSEVDRILVDEHAAATERVDNFFATIRQLHTERAPMKRILAVVTPVVEQYATYAKEGCCAQCYAVRAILNGKKVPWHEEDWGMIASGRDVNSHCMEHRDISPFCEEELLHVVAKCTEANPFAEFGNEVDQEDQDNVLATLPWRFWAEQIMQGSEGYMMVRGNWCKMTVEVAQGEYRVIDGVTKDVEDEEYLEEYSVTGEGPPPSVLPCLHRWRLNKFDSTVVEADQFATVLAMLEVKWTPQNGHYDAFPFPREAPERWSTMLQW